MTHRPLAQADQARAEVAQLRDALRAVYEALNIPHAATMGGEESRAVVLNHRALHATLMLERLVEHADADIAWEIGLLRDHLAEHPPVGYVTHEQAHAALAEGKSWAEAVTPSAPEVSAAAGEPAPSRLERGEWGADVPAAESAATLRRAADQIEDTAYGHVDVVGVIVQAASETRALSPTDTDLAHAAAKDLCRHLMYDTSRDSRLDLARWCRIRTPAQIVAELRAAADGLDAAAAAEPATEET